MNKFTSEIGGEEVEFEWTLLARYRAGSIPNGAPVMADLFDKRRGFAASTAWLWACLADDEMRAKWPTPESLLAVATEDEISEGALKLARTVLAIRKNAASSMQKPSPASS